MIKEFFDKRNAVYGLSIIKELESRGFEAYYCDSKEKAREKALTLIPKSHTISWGGSMSIVEIGLIDSLVKGGYKIVDRDRALTPSERTAIMKQGLLADTFLMSANALTEDGMLVNTDGRGNRVAALTFGPDNVIVIVGINKVVRDLDAAIARIKSVAAPVNAARFDGISTPCKVSGKCSDCKSPDSICAYWSVTRLCRPQKRIKVILVGEELGF